MQRIDIESSLRKINYKFVDELTEEEKERAFESFKKVYADEMTKASDEIFKRRKVQENLSELQKQKEQDIKFIQDEINHRMANYQKNRGKNMQIKLKQHKQIEQNWRRRWQQMLKKRRFNDKLNYEKAQKVRKQTESYFEKKKQFLQTSQVKKRQRQSNRQLQNSRSFAKNGRSFSIDQYQVSKLCKPDPLPTIQRKTLSKRQFQNLEIARTTKYTLKQEVLFAEKPQIKYNREKFQKLEKERQEELFQKMITKLNKIEKNRINAQELKQKQMEDAKKIREQRQNPEKIAKNRQRSLDALNLRRKIRQQRQKSNERQTSKTNLNESISSHLQAKKMIEQQQFQQRQKSYLVKYEKIKRSKLQKLIKEAIVVLKHETLHQAKDKY